jgi:2-iminobutanoate/2-iminopropanoate deaminase
MTDLNAYRVTTDPDPYEPHNIALAYKTGNLVFVSGQAALDQQGNLVGVGDFDAQAECAFAGLKRVLEAAGSSMAKIVKVNIYMTDMSHFGKIIDLRARQFTKPYPADTIVEVKGLALPELMIEIEAVALVEGEIIG